MYVATKRPELSTPPHVRMGNRNVKNIITINHHHLINNNFNIDRTDRTTNKWVRRRTTTYGNGLLFPLKTSNPTILVRNFSTTTPTTVQLLLHIVGTTGAYLHHIYKHKPSLALQNTRPLEYSPGDHANLNFRLSQYKATVTVDDCQGPER